MGTPAPPDDGLLSLGDMWSWILPLLTAAGGWVSALVFTGMRIGQFQKTVIQLEKDFDKHLEEAERQNQRILELQRDHAKIEATLAGLPGAIMDRVSDGPLAKIETAIREMRASLEGSVRDVRQRVELLGDRDRGSHPARGRREPD